MTVIGEISEISSELKRDFQWKIDYSVLVSAESNKYYCSPEFHCSSAIWILKIYPNGQKAEDSVGFIDLFLCRKCTGQPISMEFSLFIKTTDEKIDYEFKNTSCVFEGNYEGYGNTKCLKISNVIERLKPNSTLTIVCVLKYNEFIANNAQTVKCSYCKKTSYAEVISSHERGCLNKPIKCPECGDDIELRSWYEHACQMEKEKVIGKMLHYFKDIMETGEHSDTIIQVREVEFKLHRNILAARNPFFSAMFKSDMKEKDTGVVSIDDCEPDIFRLFIHFLYTGKVETLSPKNVCSLYEIADKYQDEQLKLKCLNFMISAISVENFCEFIALALKFDEGKLFEKAVEFFTSTAKDIVRHVNWQKFLREYPTQANELFIKFVDNYVK